MEAITIPTFLNEEKKCCKKCTAGSCKNCTLCGENCTQKKSDNVETRADDVLHPHNTENESCSNCGASGKDNMFETK